MTDAVITKPIVNWQIGKTDAPPPPMISAIPFFGSAIKMGKDPIRFPVEMYQTYGPVFRAKLFNREITFMAGLDANKFTAQHDEEVFTNAIEFGWMENEVGKSSITLAPEEHRHVRRLLKPAYSRSIVENKLTTLIQVVDDFIDKLKVGDSFDVFPTMQEIVVNQLGTAIFGLSIGGYFTDVRKLLLTSLQVYQFHTRPAWVLKLPAYQRAKSRAYELSNKVMEHLRNTPIEERTQTGIDVLLNSGLG